jgi:hypothetical protein
VGIALVPLIGEEPIMASRSLATLLVISLAAGCGESFTEPVRDSAPLSLALVLVDDGSANFRPVGSNVPAFGNVWNLLAQSFTAEDRRVSFGFRMKDASAALPNAGASLEYSLYAGENSYSSSTFLARRVVVLPSTLATDPRSVFGDLGFVDADFTDVELTPGEKYTVLVGRSGFSLPDLGTTTGFGVWTSLSNPYSGGRFFFPVGYAGWVGLLYNNDFFSQQDMLFRVTPASVTQIIGALVGQVISPSLGFSNGEKTSLTAKLQAALGYLQAGATADAIAALQAFIHEVNALVNSGRLTTAAAAPLISAAEGIIAEL